MVSEQARAGAPLADRRVLLVEDNHVNRLVAKAVLEKAGALVTTASDGRAALETLAARGPFDVVLMDVQMPELDGFEATRLIRKDPAGHDLLIIAMTAQASAEERRTCLAAGMDDHLPKPIDPEHTVRTLAAWLNRRDASSAPAADPLPAPAEPPRDEVTGIDEVAALQRLGGDRLLLARLLRLFAQDATGVPERLRQARLRQDESEVRRLIHTLKGEAGNVSATSVWATARLIEGAVRDGRDADVEQLLGRLEQQIEEVVAAVRRAPAEPADAPAVPMPRPPITRQIARGDQSVVLAVDDTPLNVEALQAILAGTCRVVVAYDGQTALTMAMAHAPDLVLLDVMMPGLDGYEVCARLKANPATANIPVIFVTTMEEEADEARGLEIGAIDYLTKPLKAPIVRARVRNHLELKRYRDLLENLSTKDPLTGIANRRRLDEVLSHEWRRALRAPAPLSLVFIDLDFFKAFNDTYGHAAGDECLRAVASELAGATRRFTDLVARYGGEEFACVLPSTDAHGASIIANRLRDAIARLQIPHEHSPVAGHVTISLGAATMVPAPGESVAALIEEADRRLYEAKRSGRNRVVAPED